MGHGATAFTRITFSATISARPAVKLEIAPFVDAYARRWGEGCRDWTDVVLMIELPGRM